MSWVGAAIVEDLVAKTCLFGLTPLDASANYRAQKKVGHQVGAGIDWDERGVGDVFHLRHERPDKKNE